MNISFDLDGVIADTDVGLLAQLCLNAREEKPGAEEYLQSFYASRQVRLDPLDFLADGDGFFIVSCRVPSAWATTRRWVERRFPDAGLLLVSTTQQEQLFSEGRYAEGSQLGADLKYQAIVKCSIDLHIDNNPMIVQRLRELGVTAVLYGGASEGDNAAP